MDTNSYNKEIFVKDYFNIHNHYFKIYGKSTLILMQVGSFHECYIQIMMDLIYII